jgi:protein transport protein SEC24
MIFAAAITPFGVHSEDFPLASFGQDPIVRCENCRTYLNPYCRFLDGGYRWRCNVCGKSESIPAKYYR